MYFFLVLTCEVINEDLRFPVFPLLLAPFSPLAIILNIQTSFDFLYAPGSVFTRYQKEVLRGKNAVRSLDSRRAFSRKQGKIIN